MVKNALEWLNQEFPTRENKEKVQKLVFGYEGMIFIWYKGEQDPYEKDMLLEGELDASEFIGLEELEISCQLITSLKLGKNEKLKHLQLSNCDQLTTIQNLEYCTNLERIAVTHCKKIKTPFAFLGAWKQEIQTLKEKLVEAQQKYQNHLSQEKTQLTKEIQLIKGVIQ